MAEVFWRDEALDDLDAIVAYVEQFDPDAAKRLQRRLKDLGDSLWYSPERGRPGVQGLRELPSVSPYVLRYRVEGDRVHIVGIRHSRRKPLD